MATNITTAVQYDVLNDGSVIKVATADFKGETIPVGTCIWNLTGLPMQGYLDLSIDHGLLQRSEYPQLWAVVEAMIASYGSNSASVVLTDAAWLAEVAANSLNASESNDTSFGTCGKFSRGDGSTTFRVPLIRYNWLHNGSPAYPNKVGTYSFDQMRAITGTFQAVMSSSGVATGAVYEQSQAPAAIAGGSGHAYKTYGINSALLGTHLNGYVTHPRSIEAHLYMKAVDTTTATFQQGTYELAPSTIPLRGTNGYSQDWQGAFPDRNNYLDIAVPANGGTFVIPADGWLSMQARTNGANAEFTLVSVEYVESHYYPYAHDASIGSFFPAFADTVQLWYAGVTGIVLRFFYPKGAI